MTCWSPTSVPLLAGGADTWSRAKPAQDITDRRAEREALAHRAQHDPLTGLPNRVLLFDRLEHALQRRERQRTTVAVLFCDLDEFKRINDTYGHRAGDDVLVELARRLRAVQRPGDTVARLAGDEFVVLCEDSGQPEASSVVRRIHEALATPFDVGGTR